MGSVGVSSDNAEVYAATLETVVQVLDRDTYGEIAWSTRPNVLEPREGESTFNLLVVAIGANGLLFQAGVGKLVSQGSRSVPLPRQVGVGLLDRKTGAVRHFTEGLDESVAVASTGPDGVAYIGNSPVRRAFSRLLGEDTPPLVGGISKYGATRLDALVVDAACAGSTRARNAETSATACPESAAADALQIRQIIEQARRAASLSTELSGSARDTILSELDHAEAALDEEPPNFHAVSKALARVSRAAAR